MTGNISGNRHYSAYCHCWLVPACARRFHRGTIAGNRHYRATSTLPGHHSSEFFGSEAATPVCPEGEAKGPLPRRRCSRRGNIFRFPFPTHPPKPEPRVELFRVSMTVLSRSSVFLLKHNTDVGRRAREGSEDARASRSQISAKRVENKRDIRRSRL